MSNVSKSSNIYVYIVYFYFSRFTFPQSKQHIIVFKLKLNVSHVYALLLQQHISKILSCFFRKQTGHFFRTQMKDKCLRSGEKTRIGRVTVTRHNLALPPLTLF